MTLDQGIQIGILFVAALSLISSLIFWLLRQHRVIVDIEERQKRLDLTAENARSLINEAEKKAKDDAWRNNIFLVLMAVLMLVIAYRRDIVIAYREGKK